MVRSTAVYLYLLAPNVMAIAESSHCRIPDDQGAFPRARNR